MNEGRGVRGEGDGGMRFYLRVRSEYGLRKDRWLCRKDWFERWC